MTNSDLRTQVWSRFTKELELRLQELREFNDSTLNSETKTALIRGQISEVKRLLALSPDESAGAADFPIHGEVETSLT